MQKAADDKRGDWQRHAFCEYYGLSESHLREQKLPDSLIAQVMACKSDEARRLLLGKNS